MRFLNFLLRMFCRSRSPAARMGFAISSGNTMYWTNTMAHKLIDLTTLMLSIAFRTAAGNLAAAPGPITWTSSDPTIATVAPTDETGARATITSVGPLGEVTITATCGSLVATDVITVIPGAAVSMEIVDADPVPGAA